MLKLAGVLAETEPDKAERLRDALNRAGQARLKDRIEQIAGLLRSERLSDAERGQIELQRDLEALLDMLLGEEGDRERHRRQRQELDRLRRSVRALLDRQLEHLYRTQQIEQELRRQAGEGNAPDRAVPSIDADAALRQLEQLQRQTQQQALELHRQIQQSPPDEPQGRAVDPTGRAAEHMQRAADRLGERQPEAAQPDQQQAAEQLQEALDRLEEALRQVRREESLETLSALETRLRGMLEGERRVLEAMRPLVGREVSSWERSDELRLAEAAQVQEEVAAQAQAVLRILAEEGTTVILPELMRQMSADMSRLAEDLKRQTVTGDQQRTVEEIIDQLEQILSAVEATRDRQMRAPSAGGAMESEDQAAPLLPDSAELKLLRAAQVQLQQRTQELAEAPAALDPQRQEMLRQLGVRQQNLAELAWRMNQRRQ